MKFATVLSLGFVCVLAGTARSGEEPSDLVVHEWGTFLSMQGSDGVTLDGMYHEEHALPGFVHARSRDQLRLPSAMLKGETPVIYFYTDRRQSVHVQVGFPTGVWTQWYPQASLVVPALAEGGLSGQFARGRIHWSAEIIPARDANISLPTTSEDSLWNFSREVDAAYVSTVDHTRSAKPKEFERFIFYRGLGHAPLPIEMTSTNGGTIRAKRDGTQVEHIFAIRVEQGRGTFRYIESLEPGQSIGQITPNMTDAQPLDEFVRSVSNALAVRLVQSGLYEKEARAMVNTWTESYFRTEGVRLLFVLPQKWTDEFIPMHISPKPKQLVRVMVGRIEALTPERERLAENALRSLVSEKSATREQAFAFLQDQGRYVEPIIRRVLQTTNDVALRNMCKRLLLTPTVTELRTAATSPETGARVYEERAHVRARLASLLRELGEDQAARQEATIALEELAKLKNPPMQNHTARHHLRAYARAFEGLGDDRNAAEWYGKFIRFAAQMKTNEKCAGCHTVNEAPTDMAWFQDWWVGSKFAELHERLGDREQIVRDCKSALERKNDETAARMMLAYLYQSNGQPELARTEWRALGVEPKVTVAASKSHDEFPELFERALPSQAPPGARHFTLSGGPDVNTPIIVDDDLTVRLNGELLFADNDGWASTDERSHRWGGKPISFYARPGDTLSLVVYDLVPVDWRLGPLYLHGPDGRHELIVEATGGSSAAELSNPLFDKRVGAPGRDAHRVTMLERTFTIGEIPAAHAER